MRAWRGPKQSYKPTATDGKNGRRATRRWEPGETIWFDGTIDKSGRRGTDFGIELDAQDVIALQVALGRHYGQLVKERALLEKTVNELEEVLGKIWRLVALKRYRAPYSEDLISAIEEIAEHYQYSSNREERFKPSFKWLKWSEL